MINHDDMKTDVFSLLDGELPEHKRAVIDAHVRECRECQEMAPSWEKTATLFVKSLAVHPSEDFVRQVMSRINQEEIQKVWSRPSLWRTIIEWSIPAVVGFALAGFSLMLATPREESLSPDEAVFSSSSAENNLSEWLVSSERTQEGKILDTVMGEI